MRARGSKGGVPRAEARDLSGGRAGAPDASAGPARVLSIFFIGAFGRRRFAACMGMADSVTSGTGQGRSGTPLRAAGALSPRAGWAVEIGVRVT